jgi:hypothetical protein
MSLTLSLFVALAVPARGEPATPADVEAVVERMIGHFTSAAQAKADREYFAVELRMVRIWPERAGEHWLYVEQAMAEAIDKPYRQRIYRVLAADGGKVESRVYELPDPKSAIGAWKKDRPLADLKPEELRKKKGCSIWLTKQPDGTWKGSTDGQGCGSELRGAKYATSEVVIVKDGLDTWDRGFNAAGKQVWGAVKGPYRFRRVSPPDARPNGPDPAVSRPPAAGNPRSPETGGC